MTSCCLASSSVCAGAVCQTASMLRIGAIRPIQPQVLTSYLPCATDSMSWATTMVCWVMADGGAVARRAALHVDRRRQSAAAAEDQLHHDRRIAGKVLGQIRRQQPGIHVVAAADAGADEQRDGLASCRNRRSHRPARSWTARAWPTRRRRPGRTFRIGLDLLVCRASGAIIDRRCIAPPPVRCGVAAPLTAPSASPPAPARPHAAWRRGSSSTARRPRRRATAATARPAAASPSRSGACAA